MIPAKWMEQGRYRISSDEAIGMEKQCSCCLHYLPADVTFFYRAARSPDGLHCYCKGCCNISIENRRRRRRELARGARSGVAEMFRAAEYHHWAVYRVL